MVVYKKRVALLCACDKAIATGICDDCPKFKAIQPTRTYYSDTWPCKVEKYKKTLDTR